MEGDQPTRSKGRRSEGVAKKEAERNEEVEENGAGNRPVETCAEENELHY